MIIGVTGGIGSGKTALTTLLSDLGAVVVDADLVAHRVVGSALSLGKLVDAFGENIISSTGVLDRRALGRRAFNDKESLDKLYAIIRPELERELKTELERTVRAVGDGLVIFDAPLIYEWGIQDWVDAVVLVDCEEETRIQRVIARSGLERKEILRRMALQMDTDEKKARADMVVDNNGDMRNLQERAQQLWRHWQQLLKCQGGK